MGIFNRNKKKNAVQANAVDTSLPVPVWNGWDFVGIRKGRRDYAAAYLWVCVSRILKGLSNVTFYSDKEDYTAKAIASFVGGNYTVLLNQYLTRGFIAVGYDRDNNYRVLGINEVRVDGEGRVTNRDAVVWYSPEYQLMRKTPALMCKPILDILNDLSNTMVATTGTMNTLPIISGNSIPAAPSFKEELASAMSKDYGWDDDQLKYFLSKTELKVDSVDLGVDKLKLGENISAKFKELLNYWNIPIPLVMDDASTYNNIVEARKEFYGTCIRFYAEALLSVAQALLTASEALLPKSTINYGFRNIPEMEKTLSGYCSEQKAYIELLEAFAKSGVDVTSELDRVYAEVKKRVREV